MFVQVVLLFYMYLLSVENHTNRKVLITKRDIKSIEYLHVNEYLIDLNRIEIYLL